MDAMPREMPEGIAGRQAGERADAIGATVLWAGVGVAAFQVALVTPELAWLMGVFLFAVVQLSFARTARVAFYVTFLAMGVCYGLRLGFFWGIFGVGAVALWGFLAVWVAGFVLIVRGLRGGVPRWAWAVMLPVVWTGMEYFRCEWNPLRFTWLTPGMAMGHWWGLHLLGVYGVGMGMMACVALVVVWWRRPTVLGIFAVSTVLVGWAYVGVRQILDNPAGMWLVQEANFVGIQLEEASPSEIVRALDKAVAVHPEGEMFVLGEYSVMDPPPVEILDWARVHQKYVMLGGVEYADPKQADGKNYYDTAFVVGPEGKVVFSQGKVLPVQLMQDGLPANGQRVWDSPWGKIGICICYDLSYRRVTDELIRQGAQVLVVPTMDAEGWGAAEHELHARVAPVRAAEYGVPVFRVTTSGISQSVDAMGNVVASAPFPGQREMVASEVVFSRDGAVPVDWVIGPVAAVVTAGGGGVDDHVERGEKICSERKVEREMIAVSS